MTTATASTPAATAAHAPATNDRPRSRQPESAETLDAGATARIPVTVTLDSEVYNHFSALAKQDDRSLAKFLSRLLRAEFQQIQPSQQEDF